MGSGLKTGRLMGSKSKAHEDATIESFRRDPAFAAEYLNAVLEDGDQTELLTALRYMAGAFGGVAVQPDVGMK